MLNNFKTDHVVSSTQRILATTPWKLGVLDICLTGPQAKESDALLYAKGSAEATAQEGENTEQGSRMNTREIG